MLFQANLAAVEPGSLVCDPYVGTGSLIIAAAHFGGYGVGTEISYKVVHGIGKSSRNNVGIRGPNENVRANFEQYGIADRYLDVMLADASRSQLWRSQPLFDAIITDPPYGIREKGAKLGSKRGGEVKNSDSRVPGKVQYEYANVYLDLLNFAAEYLVVGGRIAYWLPVLYAVYSDEHIPQHPCLELVHNCLQRLTTVYGRRLVVMRKMRNKEEVESAFLKDNPYMDVSLRDIVLPSSSGERNRLIQKISPPPSPPPVH